jgi:DNA polymerase-3 subunit gamma/tau
LRTIAHAEGITISDEGLAMIARAAEGSMRDSQSLMDQAVSYSGLSIKDEDLQASLGSVAQQALRSFAAGLLSRDAASLLMQLDGLLEQGQDLRQFLSGVVEHVRNLLVVKTSANAAAIVELPAADIDAISQQAADATTEQLLMLFDSLSKTLDDMRWSLQQRFTAEVGIIKACSLAPLKPLSEVLTGMRELEARLATGQVSAPRTAAASAVTERAAGYGSHRPQQAPIAPSAVRSGAHDDQWSAIMAALKAKKPGLATFLNQASLIEAKEGELVIGIRGTGFQRDQVEKQENREVLEAVAGEVVGRKVRIKVQSVQSPAKETKSGPAAAAGAKQPVKRTPEEQDPLVQDALRIFGGEVVEQDPAAE